MDADVKQRWVAALRSGNFPQARGRLYDGIGYCCLGVLCEVAEPGWLDADNDDDEAEEELTNAGRYNCDIEPPPIEALGIAHSVLCHLTDRNDGKGPFDGNPQDFPAIANYIEETL